MPSLAFSPLPILPTPLSLPSFRSLAFSPSTSPPQPVLLPSSFTSLPAIRRWTHRPSPTSPLAFNTPHLLPPGPAPAPHSPLLPTELHSPSTNDFRRTCAPLSLFLDYAKLHQLAAAEGRTESGPRLTVAQAPLSLLPGPLRADLPTPSLVLQAGRGDEYGDSLWLGVAPTSTPLHRDPNPNLLVQVAGRKLVRLLSPEVGGRLWERVGSGGRGTVRGEDMMVGVEQEVLEGVVWDGRRVEEAGHGIEAEEHKGEEWTGWEGTIEAGDGIFIPTGWWHAVRGVGDGVVASVNWWFR